MGFLNEDNTVCMYGRVMQCNAARCHGGVDKAPTLFSGSERRWKWDVPSLEDETVEHHRCREPHKALQELQDFSREFSGNQARFK